MSNLTRTRGQTVRTCHDGVWVRIRRPCRTRRMRSNGRETDKVPAENTGQRNTPSRVSYTRLRAFVTRRARHTCVCAPRAKPERVQGYVSRLACVLNFQAAARREPDEEMHIYSSPCQLLLATRNGCRM